MSFFHIFYMLCHPTYFSFTKLTIPLLLSKLNHKKCCFSIKLFSMKFFSSYREIRFWNKSICSGLDVSLINIDLTLEFFLTDWKTENVNTTNCCYRLIKRVYRGAFSIVLFHSAESLSKASAAWAERLSSSVRVSMRSAPFGWAYSHWP